MRSGIFNALLDLGVERSRIIRPSGDMRLDVSSTNGLCRFVLENGRCDAMLSADVVYLSPYARRQLEQASLMGAEVK